MTNEDKEIMAACARGRLEWIKQNPSAVQAAQERSTHAIADNLGVDHDELLEVEIDREIGVNAQARRMDATEMLLCLGAESDADGARLLGINRARIRAALGE